MPQPKKDDVYAVLGREFDQSVVQQKGRFSYISHGLITQRLIEADPQWSSTIDETYTFTASDGSLHCGGVLLTLCINVDGTQVCRSEGGGPQRQEVFALEFKNACSDALKRCAMRFGVALSLWEDLTDAARDEDYERRPVPDRKMANGQPTGDRRVSGASTPLPATEADRETIRQLSYKLGETFKENATMTHADAVSTIKDMSARLSGKGVAAARA